MHGLILVTWEKYLGERFGHGLLDQYRALMRDTLTGAPLSDRVYNDEMILRGMTLANSLTGVSPEVLQREYGHYFIVNGLTSHLCAYLLNQVHSARELLLTMRLAHMQLSRAGQGVTPPVFEYETLPQEPNGLILIYDSPRRLCPLLRGAIEGAADRYGEEAWTIERTCMLHGAPSCRFEIRFAASGKPPLAEMESPEQRERWEVQRQLADLVYSLLPEQDGITLEEITRRLQLRQSQPLHMRPYMVLDALNHLQHAGWVASSTQQPGDELNRRRYWRIPPVF